MNSNTKRIAKNTFFLYIRMGMLMLITLYTSRVLLDKLGVQDFGIYNVIGGMAGMFTFFTSSLANATQRFLNIELGKGCIDNARLIFQQHFTLYLVIILGVVVVAEPVGLWLIYNKLVIPPDRLVAALWVFQFTLLSLNFTFLGIVFNSEIVSHEDMKVYSYIGVIEGFAKLLICYVIAISDSNRLIFYGFLLMLLTISIQMTYAIFCFRKYEECKIRLIWKKELLKGTAGIVGWNTYGSIVWMINGNFMDLLLNMFFGPVVNAARAISFQINSALSNFTSNFLISLRPQLMKSYARKDFEYLHTLLYNSTRYSIFIVFLLSFPVMFCITPILHLWLNTVPEYTEDFSILILCILWVCIPKDPLWELVLASGNLKRFQLVCCSILLLGFPLAYILLKNSFPPISVYFVLLFVRLLYYIAAVFLVKPIAKYSLKDYCVKIYVPVVRVVAISLVLHFITYRYFLHNLWLTFSFIAMSLLLNIVLIYLLGINKEEKKLVLGLIKNKLSK
jgi:O-antigen/teichoic acid export membrane protein